MKTTFWKVRVRLKSRKQTVNSFLAFNFSSKIFSHIFFPVMSQKEKKSLFSTIQTNSNRKLYIHVRFAWVQVLYQHNSTTIWKFIQKTHWAIHKSTGFLKITTLKVKYLDTRYFFNYNWTCIYFMLTHFWPTFSFYTHWKPRKSNFNPFLANVSILYLLNSLKKIFWCFQGV